MVTQASNLATYLTDKVFISWTIMSAESNNNFHSVIYICIYIYIRCGHSHCFITTRCVPYDYVKHCKYYISPVHTSHEHAVQQLCFIILAYHRPPRMNNNYHYGGWSSDGARQDPGICNHAIALVSTEYSGFSPRRGNQRHLKYTHGSSIL